LYETLAEKHKMWHRIKQVAIQQEQ
jgi:hypothetical protein